MKPTIPCAGDIIALKWRRTLFTSSGLNIALLDEDDVALVLEVSTLSQDDTYATARVMTRAGVGLMQINTFFDRNLEEVPK